ncbi:hypothetical protein LRP88_04696 [Fusarium phalaenopsidis]
MYPKKVIHAVVSNGKLFTETGDEGARQKVIAAAAALILELENPGEQLARIDWARILKHLAANGIVKEVGMDQHVATPFSMSTRDPTMEGGLIYSFESMILTFQGLPEFLAKTNYQLPKDTSDGPVQYGLRTEKPFFSILKENVRLGKAFNGFMTGYAKARPRWVDFYTFEERLAADDKSAEKSGPLLVDSGGGVGHELLGLHAIGYL